VRGDGTIEMSRRKRARPILIDLADNEDVPVLAPPEQVQEVKTKLFCGIFEG